MDRLHFGLLLLSIAIIALPIIGAVALYSNNLIELVVPPELQILLNGDYSELFTPPTLQGLSGFDPTKQTVTFTFKVTNPLPNALTLYNSTGALECTQHNFLLGNISLPQPATIPAHQTADVQATYYITQDGVLHVLTAHLGQSSLDVNFENLNIELAGATIHINEVYAGSIPLPTL
jgi:hypothetical protein